MSLPIRFAATIILVLLCSFLSFSQPKDTVQERPYESTARELLTTGLRTGWAYDMLRDLSTNVGARLSGSPEAAKAVAWAKEKMESLGFQNVRLEPVMVPHWVRGDIEEAFILGANNEVASNGNANEGNMPLTICALGGSIATPEEGITAEVIEVQTFDELRALGEKAKGKIIFFNRPMDKGRFQTFEAYGGAVSQRGQGAIEAAKVGGVAALVRSVTTRLDDVPHTGAMRYIDSIPKVPAAAVSTVDANYLSDLLKKEKSVKIRMKLSCETLPDVESANVVGEIVGSEKPEEVIVVGGHLDSWDKGDGSHDDGAGCIQSIEALRLLKELGLTPKRTIRAVMFMNEENGLRGGVAYAEKERPGETHIAAMESDAGGHAPRGFGVSADSAIIEKFTAWEYLFAGMDADRIRKGGGGADISPLAKQNVPLIGLRPDPHRYFDYHHSDNDTFDKVNERELELGAIAMAILSYVIAQEGL